MRTPGAQQRRAASVYSLFGAAGFTLGLLLSALLLQASWRWIFIFPALASAVLLGFALRVLPSASERLTRARIPFHLLRGGPLGSAALGAATLNGTSIGLLLLVNYQIQGQFGCPPRQSALALLPACVPLAVTVPFAGRLIAYGATVPVLGCVLLLLRPVEGTEDAGSAHAVRDPKRS